MSDLDKGTSFKNCVLINLYLNENFVANRTSFENSPLYSLVLYFYSNKPKIFSFINIEELKVI